MGGTGFLKLLSQLWPYKHRLLGFIINERMQPHIIEPTVYHFQGANIKENGHYY